MKILALTLFLFLLFSCNSNNSPRPNYATRDSLLKRHFSMVDTMPYYDTTNVDFKFLKAYSINDTTTLKELQKYLDNINTKAQWELDSDSCIKLKKFVDLEADEAYRFEYRAAFCQSLTTATIIKSGNLIRVNCIVYQPAFFFDSTSCKLIEQKETVLDSISWDKFQSSMNACDFWGLKEDNGHHGNDGNTLKVYGYQRALQWNPERRSYVSRWSRSMDNLLSSFIMLLRFCKISKGCLRPA